MSIFAGSLFGPYRSLSGLGSLPAGALPVEGSEYTAHRRDYPDLPAPGSITRVTHYTFIPSGQHDRKFSFYASDGSLVRDALVRHRSAPELAQGSKFEVEPLPARSEDDGLLPGSASRPAAAAPRWLPYALVGGGILVACGIVFTATRRPSVRPNRRRQRRKRR
jgi:hypothetical protein